MFIKHVYSYSDNSYCLELCMFITHTFDFADVTTLLLVNFGVFLLPPPQSAILINNSPGLLVLTTNSSSQKVSPALLTRRRHCGHASAGKPSGSVISTFRAGRSCNCGFLQSTRFLLSLPVIVGPCVNKMSFRKPEPNSFPYNCSVDMRWTHAGDEEGGGDAAAFCTRGYFIQKQ